MTTPARVRLDPIETEFPRAKPAEAIKISKFDPYGGRPCFVCHAEGDCPHREPEVALAVRFAFRVATGENADPLPALPAFRYLERPLSIKIDALPDLGAGLMKYPSLERKPMGVARTSRTLAIAKSKKRRKA